MYKRVLLKLSGELLSSNSNNLDVDYLNSVSSGIASLHSNNIDVCVVIGGGNILRGVSLAESGIERSTADYMGMLATIINSLAIQNAIEKHGVNCRVLSAIPMTTVCEPYIRRRAIRHLEKRRVVIFAAGIGSPFFSTDTAAVLRSVEMNCNVLLKGTKVDGVYSDDPEKNANAKYYPKITYNDVISNNLKVMDSSAIALAKDNKMPIIVFSMYDNNLTEVIDGKGKCTVIS